MSKFVFLIPLLPLIGFLINGLGRNLLSRTAVVLIGCGTLILSFLLSVRLFKEILSTGIATGVITYFDFINTAGLDIKFAFQVDQLSVLFC